MRNLFKAAHAAAVLLLAAFCGNISAEEAASRLRVLTYNIHHGEGTDGKLDLERIAAVITAEKPDLVALQEVDQRTQRTDGVDQAERLGALTGLHSAFGKAMDYQGGGYGLAILSRCPLSDLKVHALPSDAGVEPRAVFEARVKQGNDNTELTFLVTHVDHKADPKDRAKQIAKLRELFPASSDERPMILAGDMNARPDSAVIKELLSDWSDSAAGEQFLTIPAGKPRSKIDYVLYRPVNRWRVVETRAIEEPIASDHRPVLAVFESLP